MIGSLLLAGLLMQATPSAQPVTPQTPPATESAPTVRPDKPKLADPEPDFLLKVKRIYVDSFGDDTISKQLQSMIVSSLVKSKRFRVTENKDRADAILKGVALEKTSQEVHAFGESTTVAGAAGAQHGEVSGSIVNGNGTVSGSSSGGFSAHHLATDDSSLNTETINDARVAVRLITPDGDVVWTCTQESKGAKYVGASADVADKCVKQLLRDVEKLEAASSHTGGAVSPAIEPKQ
jgi:curli biogenesis system outer membrane secretion channel CsgG